MHRSQNKNKIILILLMMFGMFLGSCKGPLNLKDDLLNAQKVYITISTNLSDSEARTVLPTGFNTGSTGLTWTLTGTKEGSSTAISYKWEDEKNSSGEVSKSAYNKMTSFDTVIELEEGKWTFELTVNNTEGKKVLQSNLTQTISSATDNLKFVMQEPTEGDVAQGKIEFKLTFPAGTVGKVAATLTKYGETNAYENPKSVTPQQDETEVSVTYTNTVDAGTYMLKLDLQQQDPAGEQYKTINTYTCLIRVAPGLLSKGSDKLNSLAKLYKITYELNGGTIDPNVTITSYNQYTKFSLPTPARDEDTFLGWCTHETCSVECEQLKPEETIISISEDTKFYAKWQAQPTSPDLSDQTNGLLYFSKTEGNIDCLEIYSAEGLKAYRDYINRTTTSLQVAYKYNNGHKTFSGNFGRIDAYLMEDITVENWIPIGKKDISTYFEFEGNKKTITINSIDSSSEYVGVFGYVGNATATNLKIKNLTVAGTISTEKQYAGGIVAYSNGATIENCVNRLQITGNSENTIVGGIVGYSQKGTVINNCVNFANLTSAFVVGGIVGTASFIQNTDYTLTLSKCINLGEITGSAVRAYISGMVAKSNVSANISNCINIGQISGPSTSGATATSTGFIYLIEKEYVNPELEIYNCINTNNEPTGYVTNSIFVGNTNGTIVSNSNLYYDSTKWSSSESLNDPNDINKTGKTTTDLCTLNSENLFTDWSFAEDGSRYPLPNVSETFSQFRGSDEKTVWDQICVAAKIQNSASAAVMPSDL